MNHSFYKILLIVFSTVIIGLMFLIIKSKYNNSISNNNIIEPSDLNRTTKFSSKNVFFDLGANRGDTVFKFLDGQVIDLRVIGFKKWVFHAFEPNPRFTVELKSMERNVSQNHEMHLYHNTAAWTYDGFITFYLDTRSKFSEGSSFLKKHPFANQHRNLTVRCLDVAKMINKYEIKDYVVVKIDIEGAEYDLIMHLIKENAIEKIDYLIIEFHKYLSKFKEPEDVFSSLFKLYNISYKSWY